MQPGVIVNPEIIFGSTSATVRNLSYFFSSLLVAHLYVTYVFYNPKFYM